MNADVELSKITLKGGKVDYTDNFIKPNYTANLTDMEGSVGAFGTKSTTPAPVSLDGKINGSSPINIDGSINPLVPTAFVDIKAKADAIELTGLSPYTTKYTGYPIIKGTLTRRRSLPARHRQADGRQPHFYRSAHVRRSRGQSRRDQSADSARRVAAQEFEGTNRRARPDLGIAVGSAIQHRRDRARRVHESDRQGGDCAILADRVGVRQRHRRRRAAGSRRTSSSSRAIRR